MINLLQEIIEVIAENNKLLTDIKFVTDDQVFETWDSFNSRANIYYDNGYGGHEISLSLKIVGRDFWLERHEYDGSEWWEFKTLPIRPETRGKVKIHP